MKSKIILIACLLLILAVPGCPAFAAHNPLATNDQLYAEDLVQYILTDPAVESAIQTFSEKWLALVGTVSSEQMAYFDEAVKEKVVNNILTMQTAQSNYPKIISIPSAPHSWFGINFPGSRGIFDNPDTIYRSVYIDPSASYIIYGKRRKSAPIDENYSLYDNKAATLWNIAVDELVVDKHGSFVITMDPSPANGRKNHIQLTSTAKFLFVRTTVNDWATQNVTSLSIERVDEGTFPPAPTFDDLANATVNAISNYTNTLKSYYNRVNAQPVNTLPAITRGGTSGTLSTQAQEYSAWAIADDEALVVTVNTGGAKYIECPVYNWWQITTDYIHHTSILNNAQAVPNKNGTYTFVISVKDPGVYNWVDTNGLHEGLLNLRWQVLPKKAPASGDVAATMQLVKLADLKKVLPKHTKYVTAKERKKQLKQRAAAFERRYAEHYKY